MRILILLGIVLYSQFVFGQTIHKSKIDTNFINHRTARWSIRAYGISKYNEFTLSDETARALFFPDVKLGAGLGFSFHNIALDFAFNIYSDNRGHESENLSLVSSIYINKNLLDLEFQVYNRYTVSVSDAATGGTLSEYRDDITVINAGINYDYNFNYHRFSFNAPFIGTEIQKRSSGSPLVGFFLNYINLSSDSSVIPNVLANEFSPQLRLTEANLATIGVSAGYAFTLVLPRHFYITLSLTPKIGVTSGELIGDNDRSVPVGLTPGFLTRNSIGYAGKRFYGFLSLLGDYNIIHLGGNNTLYYDPVKAKFLIGYRIK
jgi:hypothetical protein